MTVPESHDESGEPEASRANPTEGVETAAPAEPEGASERGTDDPIGEQGPEPAHCGQCTDYLDSLTRLKAEFANYRRRAAEQQAQAAERGAADLVARLLAVLDASEAGAAHHAEAVGPLHNALVEALASEGLEVISPAGEPFDPNYHEAVMHESGDTPGPQMVTDVLRTGYAWGGRVLRPAVVGVRG